MHALIMPRKRNKSKVIKKTIILTYYEENNSVAQRLIRSINYPGTIQMLRTAGCRHLFIKRHEEVICVLRASENKIHPNITASTERQVPFMLSSRKISF